MKKTKILASCLIMLCCSPALWAQTISLDSLFAAARNNYPLQAQKQAIQESSSLRQENLKQNYKPRINLEAKATYQSEVTSIDLPIPNIEMPELAKDQYRLNIDIQQIIYDFGTTKTAMQLEEKKALMALDQFEIQFYPSYQKINNLYHGILLTQKNQEAIQLGIDQLNSHLEDVKNLQENGLASSSQSDELTLELMHLKQQKRKLLSAEAELISSLNLLCDINIKTADLIAGKANSKPLQASYERPEFQLLDHQQSLIKTQNKMLDLSRYPKIAGFSQLGYGKPGYNMFSDEFGEYAMVGLMVNWNIYDWGKTKRNKNLLILESDRLLQQRNVLKRNLDIQHAQLEIKLQNNKEQQIQQEEIIELRNTVLKRKEKELLNGTILPSQYLDDMNKYLQAKIQLNELEIKASQYQIAFKIESGIIAK